MKKIIAYAARPDEFQAFENFSKKFNFEITRISERLSPENAHKTRGHDGVLFLGNCEVNKETLNILKENGIKVAASRSAGINNIDIEHANSLGIEISHVPTYSPNSVSEFAVASALALYRKIPEIIRRTRMQDFSLRGLISFEIRKSTVGIIGTGRIGREAAKAFKGLGAKVIAYDLFENEEAKKYLEYVTLDELIKNSDVISLHIPFTEENHHLFNKDRFNMMRNHAILINAARGALINTEDILEALLNNNIGGFAMDTYENEVGIFHADRRFDKIKDKTLLALSSLDNVIISPHCAFYTDEAVSNMVEIALENTHSFFENGKVINKVK